MLPVTVGCHPRLIYVAPLGLGLAPNRVGVASTLEPAPLTPLFQKLNPQSNPTTVNLWMHWLNPDPAPPACIFALILHIKKNLRLPVMTRVRTRRQFLSQASAAAALVGLGDLAVRGSGHADNSLVERIRDALAS
jgi:hypothetical protein